VISAEEVVTNSSTFPRENVTTPSTRIGASHTTTNNVSAATSEVTKQQKEKEGEEERLAENNSQMINGNDIFL